VGGEDDGVGHGHADVVYGDVSNETGRPSQNRSTTPDRASTPDTPEQKRLRDRFDRQFRAERGDDWVEKNRAMLDSQWEFAKEMRLV
jgi:hypothetical protein